MTGTLRNAFDISYMPATKTHSELIFESLIENHGLTLTKLDEGNDTTSPDYLVSNETGSAGIFEIKQMSWNKEEERINNDPEDNEFREIWPRKRIQRLINGSRKQLKAAQTLYPKTPRFPTLFSMIGSGRLDQDTLDGALFGLRGPDDEGIVRHGHEAYLTPKKNTYVSAVAVLSEEDQKPLIEFYENPFAFTACDSLLLDIGPVFYKSGDQHGLFAGWKSKKT